MAQRHIKFTLPLIPSRRGRGSLKTSFCTVLPDTQAHGGERLREAEASAPGQIRREAL